MTAHQVLARKYRSASLSELVGQEVLVTTLTNAIKSGRVHHAYIFTGIRGVGKTSTARILAKSFNCRGADGTATGPQVSPCGVCENCLAIAEYRHIDVIEMDAASHTGVDDIREIIDGAQYKPTMARYKIYIIDEVHMLSRNAFNALLKTLEEPPEFVKFIFATTEIRKVPATILSRCQRFDLARVEPEALAAHFKRIAGMEQVEIDDEALGIIAKVADGSVRDGLSFLDQAIANTDGRITAEGVRKILGLAGRGMSLDLYDAVMSGDIAKALAILEDGYKQGVEAPATLSDLLEITHYITRVKVSEASGATLPMTGAERERIGAFASRLSIAVLARAWSILLRAFDELAHAPNQYAAIEMAIVRLSYAGTLPTPSEVIADIENAKKN